MAEQRDASSRFPWPPVIYAGAALLAGLMSRLVAFPFQEAQWRSAAKIGGIVCCLLGVAIAVAAVSRFRRAGTPVPPTEPTKAMVFDGIYQFTRNPMYLGMSLVLAGLGFGLDQAWFLVALPFAMFAVTKLAIEREEAYLEQRFGAPYVTYKAKVRRWI